MATYEEKKYDFSGAAITNLAADNVTTGSIPDARFASGNITQHVDLTALNASNLTSGTIPNGRYGTPSISASNITGLSGGQTTSFSAVGAYLWAIPQSGNYTSNQTTSGGVTAAGGHTTNYIVGSTASGTWRCMGSHGRTSSPRRLTLWHRTA